MKVLIGLVLVLLLAGCAAGEGGADSTIAEEETTTHSAREETTVLTAGDFPKLPDSTLSYGGREVKGTLGSYCWSSGGGVCVDAVWPLIPSKQKTLTVPSGSEMVFRYGGQSPPKVGEVEAYLLKKLQKTKTSRPDSTLKVHGSGVEKTIPAELPPGEYVVYVYVEVPQGGADYIFRIMVE